MKKEEIKAALSGCKSFVELVGKANQLKQAGEKESIVNRVVTELRKELLSSNSSINRIPREPVPEVDETRLGNIVFAVNKLSAPYVMYNGDTILI